MAKRCRYCYSKQKYGEPVCCVCKIDATKDRKALSKSEKLTHYFCRTLHIMAFLAVLGGILGAGMMLLVLLAPNPRLPVRLAYGSINFILAIAFIIFGLALSRYKKWCYVGGIILYSFATAINALSGNLPALLMSLLFLYYIAAPLSRKVLYRQF